MIAADADVLYYSLLLHIVPQQLRRFRPSAFLFILDLKVVLGTGEDESVQWHHSQALASKSRYIDAMLSAPMKEREEQTITFPDITLATWEKLMHFLDSPVAARHMSAEDARDLALLYDKYEFLEGRKLCDEIMVDYFKNIVIKEKKLKLDLDFVIDLVNVAHRASLNAAFAEGIKYIWKKLTSTTVPYGRMMFEEKHLVILAPLLKYSLDNKKDLTPKYMSWLPEIIPELRLSTTFEAGLDNPDFPKQFISECQNLEQQHLLYRCIRYIELSGSHCNADGSFYKEACCWDLYQPADDEEGRTDSWDGIEVKFEMCYWTKENFEGWAIVRYWITEFDEDGEPDYDSMVRKLCWIAPYSKNRKLPPMQGWIPSDPAARGYPQLKYILRESIGINNANFHDARF